LDIPYLVKPSVCLSYPHKRGGIFVQRVAIRAVDLKIRPHHLWHDQSLLLTAGDFSAGDYNCMTIGWGSLGTMWSKPFVQVVVRPTRYTHQFIEKYATFTVCAFGSEYDSDLNLLGSRSGRDGNKLKLASLTPIASKVVVAPGYQEAELIIECRKVYSDVFRPERFLDNSIARNYSLKDYHTFYFGWIEAIFGLESYNL
jgi:hypothetical protein